MSGIKKYIDDLNLRFTNQLFTTKTRRISGLANLNYRTGLPYFRTGNEYEDALFNDNYDLTLFYIESGDRKSISGGFESPCDIIVCANMDSFTGYDNEDLIDEVHEIMKVTPFRPNGYARDFEALKGFTYQEKIKETMHPYFVFRIKTKLVGILNID